MKQLILLVLLLTTAAYAALSESGYYDIEEVLIRYAPETKQNGDAWDPWGGAPDLFLEFGIGDSDISIDFFTTGEKENSGTSASWSSEWEIVFESPYLESSSGAYIWVKVWDSDTYDDDFVDSGRISTSDLVVGENTIECNYGSTVTFILDGPNNEGRYHP